ncbi:putative glutamate carboxypeptidase 2 [Cladorrhinum samala]|uniref:Glutamate carboxypeptidase 2 n=1 Tax=Cladorrhinum samala TaxID=585594 RepID=A0AAV9HSU9_9PEZI|nr:putative glutamate carboxypeptidase 2 [Cladorrhinum samala]
MAPDANQRYAPVPPIPSYEEAVAAGGTEWHPQHIPPSPIDGSRSGTPEGQSLLGSHSNQQSASQPGRGRRPPGYRRPTVETDDESNLFSSSDDSDSDDEADHVRREMQELEIDDSDVRAQNRSLWRKRIAFSLPQWRWKWKWRLPQLRGRAAAAENTDAEAANADSEAAATNTATTTTTTPGARFAFPQLGSETLFLLIARIIAITMVLGFLYLIFASSMFSSMVPPLTVEDISNWIRGVDAANMQSHMRHFTSYAHIAGTEGDYAMMMDIENLFSRYGLDNVVRDEYHVYLNYPTADGRAVEILQADGKVSWKAKLEEEEVGGETNGRQTHPFHGLSKSGDVKGPLIYANYGSREDFQKLKDGGIDVKGAIALVRYRGYETNVGLKVKAAELAGFAGCLVYSDPKDDGSARVEPHAGSADAVHRSSVGLSNWIVGDVLTPGWGSKDNMPRMKIGETQGLVGIPSLPLAWRDAQALLQSLKGHGQNVPDGWAGAVPDVAEWWTGNGSSPIVRLKNVQDEVDKKAIWNVYGRIPGTEQSEKRIIVGNHRDSWAFGAGSPHSGTAVMLEVARLFGQLYASGWRPLRTVEFMSWDGSTYNLIGSTEYVEQNDDMLKKDAFAYINLDKAVIGQRFRASGSPLFRKLLLNVLRSFQDPSTNENLLELWNSEKADIEGLGMDSDYVAFQDIVGTSSLDMSFDGIGFPYASSYDNFAWMDSVGDPGFEYHKLLAQITALFVLHLSNVPVLPFDMGAYSDKLAVWTDELDKWVKTQGTKENPPAVSLDNLKKASEEVAMAVRKFVKWEAKWDATVLGGSGWEPNSLGKQRMAYNSRMADFETDLLDDEGIPGRKQFKHVVFGPQLWDNDRNAHFPSIRDAVASGNWTLAQLTVDRVATVMVAAAGNLGA